ncbi:MAG: hypothetical protein IJN90_06940 [Bacilli bacterium]|nr:hypothetical protein [Bacilli bacterium]
MNTETELLEYIYQTADLGKKGYIHLLQALEDKDNKIKKEIEKQLEGYEIIHEEVKELLKKKKIKPKDKGPFIEMINKMGTNMNVMIDNSDSKIAEMIIQGLTMGIIEMEKKIKEYEENVDKNIIKEAKKLLKYQEKCKKEIEKYL